METIFSKKIPREHYAPFFHSVLEKVYSKLINVPGGLNILDVSFLD